MCTCMDVWMDEFIRAHDQLGEPSGPYNPN